MDQQQQQPHAGDDGGGNRGRGKGRNPWAPNNEYPALRRPQYGNTTNPTNTAELNSMMSNVSVSDTVKNSGLRVEAAEFVPRNLVATPQQNQNQGQSWRSHHSVQNRLAAARDGHQGSHHHQNAYGSQHQHGNQYSYHAQQQMPYHQYGEPNHSYQRHDYGNYDRSHQANHNADNSRGDQPLDVVLTQLNSAMQTLTRNPDQFDNLVVSLVCSITPHLKNKESTEQVVNAIIDKCIIDTNFRYSGARLCSHLDAVEASTEENPSIFRDCLFERCKTEAQTQSVEWLKLKEHQFDDERKCHGLMLSLAELVAQMDTGSILAKLLIDHISTTLKNPGPNSAKYICQSLKLAGQYLERDSTTNREEIEQVMRDLSDLVTNGQVDVHIGRMVNSVQELRSNNWGRGSSYRTPAMDNNQSNAVNAQDQATQPSRYDEPVLYGPDGMILSAEERRFCQDALADDGEDWIPGQDQQINHQDEDEDDMIAAAYEEFLKLPGNKVQNLRGNRG